MALSAGTITAYLTLQAQQFTQGLINANAQMKATTTQYEKDFGKIGAAASKAGTMVGVAFAGMSAAVGKSVHDAMMSVESENLAQISFGAEGFKEAVTWSQNLSKELGLNQYAMRKSAATIAVMTNSMGLSQEKANAMGMELATLSADMASFYNLGDEEAFQKIQAGLSGEMEPLKRLGIIVNETMSKQAAYRHGVAKEGEALDEVQKLWGRYYAIMDQTSKAQGDLARTITSPVNQMRLMKSRMEEFSIEFGRAFLPHMQKMMQYMPSFISMIKKVTPEMAVWTLGITGGTMALLKLTPALLKMLSIANEAKKLAAAGQALGIMQKGALALTNPVVLLVIALGALIAIAAKTDEGFKKTLVGIGQSLMEVGKALGDVLVVIAKMTADLVKLAVAVLAPIVIPLLKTVFAVLGAIVTVIKVLFANPIGKIFLVAIASAVGFIAIVDKIGGAFGGAVGMAGKLVDVIKRLVARRMVVDVTANVAGGVASGAAQGATAGGVAGAGGGLLASIRGWIAGLLVTAFWALKMALIGLAASLGVSVGVLVGLFAALAVAIGFLLKHSIGWAYYAKVARDEQKKYADSLKEKPPAEVVQRAKDARARYAETAKEFGVLVAGSEQASALRFNNMIAGEMKRKGKTREEILQQLRDGSLVIEKNAQGWADKIAEKAQELASAAIPKTPEEMKKLIDELEARKQQLDEALLADNIEPDEKKKLKNELTGVEKKLKDVKDAYETYQKAEEKAIESAKKFVEAQRTVAKTMSDSAVKFQDAEFALQKLARQYALAGTNADRLSVAEEHYNAILEKRYQSERNRVTGEMAVRVLQAERLGQTERASRIKDVYDQELARMDKAHERQMALIALETKAIMDARQRDYDAQVALMDDFSAKRLRDIDLFGRTQSNAVRRQIASLKAGTLTDPLAVMDAQAQEMIDRRAEELAVLATTVGNEVADTLAELTRNAVASGADPSVVADVRRILEAMAGEKIKELDAYTDREQKANQATHDARMKALSDYRDAFMFVLQANQQLREGWVAVSRRMEDLGTSVKRAFRPELTDAGKAYQGFEDALEDASTVYTRGVADAQRQLAQDYLKYVTDVNSGAFKGSAELQSVAYTKMVETFRNALKVLGIDLSRTWLEVNLKISEQSKNNYKEWVVGVLQSGIYGSEFVRAFKAGMGVGGIAPTMNNLPGARFVGINRAVQERLLQGLTAGTAYGADVQGGLNALATLGGAGAMADLERLLGEGAGNRELLQGVLVKIGKREDLTPEDMKLFAGTALETMLPSVPDLAKIGVGFSEAMPSIKGLTDTIKADFPELTRELSRFTAVAIAQLGGYYNRVRGVTGGAVRIPTQQEMEREQKVARIEQEYALAVEKAMESYKAGEKTAGAKAIADATATRASALAALPKLKEVVNPVFDLGKFTGGRGSDWASNATTKIENIIGALTEDARLNLLAQLIGGFSTGKLKMAQGQGGGAINGTLRVTLDHGLIGEIVDNKLTIVLDENQNSLNTGSLGPALSGAY